MPHFNNNYRNDGRHKMDRRRFETAHLKYAVLKVVTRYPNTFQDSRTINTTLSETIDHVTPQYYNAFTSRYSGMRAWLYCNTYKLYS